MKRMSRAVPQVVRPFKPVSGIDGRSELLSECFFAWVLLHFEVVAHRCFASKIPALHGV